MSVERSSPESETALDRVQKVMARLKETACMRSGQMDETLLYGLHGAVERYLASLGHAPTPAVDVEQLTDFFTPQFVHRRDAQNMAVIILSKFDVTTKGALSDTSTSREGKDHA